MAADGCACGGAGAVEPEPSQGVTDDVAVRVLPGMRPGLGTVLMYQQMYQHCGTGTYMLRLLL